VSKIVDMKLLSLNIWCGKVYTPLMDYIKEQAKDTDIFCFQEVLDTPTDNTSTRNFRANIYEELGKILPNHVGYFSSEQEGVDPIGNVNFPITFGKAMFIRKSLDVKNVDDVFVYRRRNGRVNDDNTTHPASLQYAIINKEGTIYTIAHLHGLWNGRGKTDTEDRLEQSRKVKEFLNGAEGKIVFCGDLNLSPDTRSLAMIKKGLIDLIDINGVTTTRSSLYGKPDKFADYTIVSPDVEVKKFNVPSDEISDHLAMILEFT
jgi:endonuclease/exonuclease/phosphatase family metal-dependent hydrolase